MTTFAILLDGDLVVTDRLRSQIAGARCIAADGGMRHAAHLGVTPELWVGDFDSADAQTIAADANTPREVHNPDKAASDGELAIERAIERGATRLVLVGALGGNRTDHTMMTLLLCHRLAAERQLDVIATSGREEAIPLLPGKLLMPDLPVGTIFSVIALTQLGGLTITRAKWPLSSVNVARGNSLTLSNIACENCALTLGHGEALVLANFQRES